MFLIIVWLRIALMTQELTTYLKLECSVNGLTNAFFNGLICWLIIKNSGTITWWGAHNFGYDMLATSFILPFIVTLIVIPTQCRKTAKNKTPAFRLDTSNTTQAILSKFPASNMGRAFYFGIIGMVIIGGISLLALVLAGVQHFTPLEYSIFKGLWAGLLSAILVVPMILLALHKD
jgi:hypothetical protein